MEILEKTACTMSDYLVYGLIILLLLLSLPFLPFVPLIYISYLSFYGKYGIVNKFKELNKSL